MSLSTTQYGYIVNPMVPFTDDKGKTIKNGFIRVFMAGTSTPVLTYRNYDGATNQEKIELDNSGRVKHNVIGSKGSLYKVVVYNILHSQENPLLTVDKIAVLGASINASGATIVTGLDSVTVQEENFLKATVEGTGVELALDPTEVTSDVNTISAAETAAPDYVLPLLDKTGEGNSKKISLANLFKFALDWISRLATTITSFASGDYFVVSNTTNGARKMSKDTLLELTAQNALAGNVAPEFDPTRDEDHKYLAGESVTYEGKTYTFKFDHYGAWATADVVEVNAAQIISSKKINLNTQSLWRAGGIGVGGVYQQEEDSLCSVNIFFQKDSVVTIKPQVGVSFTLDIMCYNSAGTYLGRFSTQTRRIDFYSLLTQHPTAKSVVIYISSITGATASPENIGDIILLEDDSLFGYIFADIDVFNSFAKKQTDESRAYLNLNAKNLWHRGSINTNTGEPSTDYYGDRIYSDMVYLYPPCDLSYTLPTGVSASVGLFVYKADGTFIRWSNSFSSLEYVVNNYPTACRYRIMLYNITGVTTSVDNLDKIISFPTDKYMSNRWLDDSSAESKIDYSVLNNVFKKRTIPQLNRATKLPCFAFTFDDCHPKDREVAQLFESKGLRCGFAFIASNQNIVQKTDTYLSYQNKGHEILNHSIDGNIYNTTNYTTYQAAFTAMQTAYERLKGAGFIVNGFVAPSSAMSFGYKPIIGILNAFGFVEATSPTNRNNASTPVTNLHRLSLQSGTLQDIKDEVDSAITANELIVFYGHAADITESGSFTMQKISDVIDYVLAKRNAGLCHVDIPTNVIREYYNL